MLEAGVLASTRLRHSAAPDVVKCKRWQFLVFRVHTCGPFFLKTSCITCLGLWGAIATLVSDHTQNAKGQTCP